MVSHAFKRSIDYVVCLFDIPKEVSCMRQRIDYKMLKLRNHAEENRR